MNPRLSNQIRLVFSEVYTWRGTYQAGVTFCIVSSTVLLCLQGAQMFSCFLSPIFLMHSVKASGWCAAHQSTSKKRRYIPIEAVFSKLPKIHHQLCYHSMNWLGVIPPPTLQITPKRSSWNVFKDHNNLLKNLGIGELTDAIIKSSQAFICRICKVHKTDSVDAARHIVFYRTGKPEALSPTSDALRFLYQTMIWRNAHCATPKTSFTCTNGME